MINDLLPTVTAIRAAKRSTSSGTLPPGDNDNNKRQQTSLAKVPIKDLKQGRDSLSTASSDSHDSGYIQQPRPT